MIGYQQTGISLSKGPFLTPYKNVHSIDVELSLDRKGKMF